MSKDEKFEAGPDPDLILRARGPPKRDFRVHKLVLSLASPVFRGMFTLPQPTTPTHDKSKESDVAEMDIVEVTDPPRALEIVLRMIYPFEPPSYDGNLDVLVECLVVADKYEINGAMSRLRGALSRVSASKALRVYAIALRFEFTDLAESASHHILSSVNLTGIPQLPDDFELITATAYHKLVRQHMKRLEAVEDAIHRTPIQSSCFGCPGGKTSAGEVFRGRLIRIIMRGTPVDSSACMTAWVKAYGENTECPTSCVPKFIRAAISTAEKQLAAPVTASPQKKSNLKNA